MESTYEHNYTPLLSQVTRETDSLSGDSGTLSNSLAASLTGSKPQLQAATTVKAHDHHHENFRHENPSLAASSSAPTYPATINGEILKEIPAPTTPSIAPAAVKNYSATSPHDSSTYHPVTMQAVPEISPPQTPKMPESSTEPLDLSEAIPQIDVEMQRLQWSQNDGRDYLVRTFNKKSRQRLTPQELASFLNYLKSLPNPISHSFNAEPEDIF